MAILSNGIGKRIGKEERKNLVGNGGEGMNGKKNFGITIDQGKMAMEEWKESE